MMFRGGALSRRLGRGFGQWIRPSRKVDWVINPNLVQLKAVVRNQPGILGRILHYLKDMSVNIHNIESSFQNGDWENAYIDIFIECFPVADML